MWDCLGLEYCEDITKREQAHMWAELGGRTATQYANLHHLIMRARFNPQRHYEIYAIDIDHTLSSKDIIEQFEADPQGMADLVRERGRQLYSDRATTKARIT